MRHYIRFQPAELPIGEHTAETSNGALPEGFVFAYEEPVEAFADVGPLGGGWVEFDPETYEVVTFTGARAYDPGDYEGVAVQPGKLLRRETVLAWVGRMAQSKDTEVRRAAREWMEGQAFKTNGCPQVRSELSTDEAHAIIEPYFTAVVERYLSAGFDLSRTRLKCDPKMHDSPRHFAACREDGLLILVAPELADLNYDMVLGILAHECGHATDFLYPGEFVLEGRGALRRDRDAETDKQWRKFLNAWKQRDDDAVELTADAIAESVLGVPIGYRGPCMLQSFEGVPRPIGLR